MEEPAADYLFDGLGMLWASESGPDGHSASMLEPGNDDDFFSSLLDDELFNGTAASLAAVPVVHQGSTLDSTTEGAAPAPAPAGDAVFAMQAAHVSFPQAASMKVEPTATPDLGQPGWQWPRQDTGTQPEAVLHGWAHGHDPAPPAWPGPTTQLQVQPQPQPQPQAFLHQDPMLQPDPQLATSQQFERRTSGTSSGSASKQGATSPTSSGKQGAKRYRRQGSSGAAAAPGVGSKPSRWGQRKAALRTLEQEVARRAGEAQEVEQLNRQLKLRTTAMQYAVEARDKQLEILAAYRAGLQADGGDRSHMTEAVRRAATASLDMLAAKLRAFVAEATLLLLQLDAQPPGHQVGPGVSSRLTDMVVELCALMGTAFVLNPRMQFEALGIRADGRRKQSAAGSVWGGAAGTQGDEGPPLGLWERVAIEVRATPQQLDEVAACWELNTQLLSRLQSDIETVQNRLAHDLECSANANCGDHGRPEAPTGLVGLQKDLAASMLKQGISCRAIGFILFTKVLSPVQTARVIVHSFPFFPNAREIATCLMTMRKR